VHHIKDIESKIFPGSVAIDGEYFLDPAEYEEEQSDN